MRGLSFYAQLIRFFGVLGGLKVMLAHILQKKEVRVILQQTGTPVVLRPWNADYAVIREVFGNADSAALASGDVRTIVDLGGHTGFAAIKFAKQFPKARIYVVEPHFSNLTALNENTRPFPQISIICAAIGAEAALLGLSDDSVVSDSFSFHNSQHSRTFVSTVTVDQLFERFGFKEIDLLKVDIEGAERAIFKTAGAWLGKTRMIAIEFHGEGAREEITDAVLSQSFRCDMAFGEKAVFTKLPRDSKGDAVGL